LRLCTPAGSGKIQVAGEFYERVLSCRGMESATLHDVDAVILMDIDQRLAI
jgi:hypothetical protein